MNNSFYNDFAARFAACTLTSLVETFYPHQLDFIPIEVFF